MSINESYGWLDIKESEQESSPNSKKTVIYFMDRPIHDSISKKTNLNFIYGSFFFKNTLMGFINTLNYFDQIVYGIFNALDSINKKINNKGENQFEYGYILFALSDIISTIESFLFSYFGNDSTNNNECSDNESSEYTGNFRVNADKINSADSNISEIDKISNIYYKKINDIILECQDRVDILLMEMNIKCNEISEIKYHKKNTDDAFASADAVYSLLKRSKNNDFLYNIYCDKQMQFFNKLADIYKILENNRHLINMEKNGELTLFNARRVAVVIKFPVFIQHYPTLVKNKIIVERENNLYWNGSKVALVDYFMYIYINKNNTNKKEGEEEKEPRLPWAVVEEAFDESSLKNSKTKAQFTSGDFLEIKKILKLD